MVYIPEGWEEVDDAFVQYAEELKVENKVDEWLGLMAGLTPQQAGDLHNRDIILYFWRLLQQYRDNGEAN